MTKKRYPQKEIFRVSPEIKQMLAEIAEFLKRDKSETFRMLVEKAHQEIKNESIIQKSV